MSFLMVDPVQHCGPYSAGLPWVVAGVSLSVNVFYTIYVIFLWYVVPSAYHVVKALIKHWRLLGNKSWLTLFVFSPKESKKKGETKSSGQNLYVTAENRQITRI